MFWDIFGVWHGGIISATEIEYWFEFGVWVFRERVDGGGCGVAGHGFASSLARYAHIDGGDLGAYLWIGGVGGGEAGGGLICFWIRGRVIIQRRVVEARGSCPLRIAFAK